MKTYRVSFDLILEDDAAHPRQWVADAIWTNLESQRGEDLDNLEIAEVLNKDEE